MGNEIATKQDTALLLERVEGKRGQERADLCMKAETKAKRRLTLSLCGLGMLDESEVEVPLTAVTATEVVATTVQVPGERLEVRGPGGGGYDIQTHKDEKAEVAVTTLFPTPEADRAGLIQRARIATARLNKQRVSDKKQTHFGSPDADYATVDLAALVSYVADVEGEKL